MSDTGDQRPHLVTLETLAARRIQRSIIVPLYVGFIGSALWVAYKNHWWYATALLLSAQYIAYLGGKLAVSTGSAYAQLISGEVFTLQQTMADDTLMQDTSDFSHITSVLVKLVYLVLVIEIVAFVHFDVRWYFVILSTVALWMCGIAAVGLTPPLVVLPELSRMRKHRVRSPS